MRHLRKVVEVCDDHVGDDHISDDRVRDDQLRDDHIGNDVLEVGVELSHRISDERSSLCYCIPRIVSAVTGSAPTVWVHPCMGASIVCNDQSRL